MSKKRRTVFVALMLIVAVGINSSMVMADSLSEVREKIKNKETELEEGKRKVNDLTTRLSELDKNIAQLDASIADGERKLTVLEKELAEAQEKVDIQNSNLNSRLRNMYKNGTIGFVDVLFDSGSFSEFLTNLDMVEKIYSGDKDVLKSLQDAYDEVEAKKNEVENLQKELQQSRELADSQKNEVEEQRAEIAASNEETEKMLDELEAQAAAISAQIRAQSSSSSNSTYLGGQMAWPAPAYSRISSEYGWRIHPISGTKKFHSGVDLAAPGGTAILSANPGTVIYSGYNGGYGYCVIIDHGGGITTLYAHSSKLLVSKGQTVGRGERIANIGTTGSSTGNHLHFEVRLDGNCVNPMPYIT